MRNRAKKNTQMLTGTSKIDTVTVASAYYAIIDADVKADLEATVRGSVAQNGMTEFVYRPVHKYGSADTIAEGECGSMHDVRFIESESAVNYGGAGAAVSGTYTGDLAYTGTPGVDAQFNVHPILFPTQGSFATVGLKGRGKITFKSKSPEQIDSVNPYGTNGFFSYNFFYGGIILQEEKLLKLLVAVTA